jgi:hypothetical protein
MVDAITTDVPIYYMNKERLNTLPLTNNLEEHIDIPSFNHPVKKSIKTQLSLL